MIICIMKISFNCNNKFNIIIKYSYLIMSKNQIFHQIFLFHAIICMIWYNCIIIVIILISHEPDIYKQIFKINYEKNYEKKVYKIFNKIILTVISFLYFII